MKTSLTFKQQEKAVVKGLIKRIPKMSATELFTAAFVDRGTEFEWVNGAAHIEMRRRYGRTD